MLDVKNKSFGDCLAHLTEQNQVPPDSALPIRRRFYSDCTLRLAIHESLASATYLFVTEPLFAVFMD